MPPFTPTPEFTGEDEVALTPRDEFNVISAITTEAWDFLFGENGLRAGGNCPGTAPEGHPNLVVTLDSDNIVDTRLLGPWGEYTLYNSENGLSYTRVDDYPGSDVDPREARKLYLAELKGALNALTFAATDWNTAVTEQLWAANKGNKPDAPATVE